MFPDRWLSVLLFCAAPAFSQLQSGMAAAYTGAPQSSTSPSKADSSAAAQSLTFALPNHPGYLHLDAPNFVITELSAKPNGHEFGIRAVDKTISHAEVLGFLFLPQPAQPTATACREWMLSSEEKGHPSYRKVLSKTETRSDSGVEIALVDYEQTKNPGPFHFVRRLFVASGDLCADISITSEDKLHADTIGSLIHSLVFDPNRAPDFLARFAYATVLFDHHNPAAAAPIYASALSVVDAVPDSLTWRRVATDQASMSYGMAGDLAHSRQLNEAAIARDPDYPLYYYNLACADAEANNPAAARAHLQQAFDRRANTLPGEKLPDPTQDDSLQKLKGNQSFWAFVQKLSKS